MPISHLPEDAPDHQTRRHDGEEYRYLVLVDRDNCPPYVTWFTSTRPLDFRKDIERYFMDVEEMDLMEDTLELIKVSEIPEIRFDEVEWPEEDGES